MKILKNKISVEANTNTRCKFTVRASTKTEKKFTVKASTKNSKIVASEQDDTMIDALWDACYDVDNLQDIDYEDSDTDGTLFIFAYGNSTNDYEARESQLINALESSGYTVEYGSSNGSNVIVLNIEGNINAATHPYSSNDVDNATDITNSEDGYKNNSSEIRVRIHLNFPGWYILYETTTGGTLKTGTKDMIIEFCREKLAASVPNLSQLAHMIDKAGASEQGATSKSVTASIGKPNPTDDMEYYTALGDGVINAYNEYWNGQMNITYEISDKAITFMDDGATYIQPLENITPDWDDIESDIQELFESVIGNFTPDF